MPMRRQKCGRHPSKSIAPKIDGHSPYMPDLGPVELDFDHSDYLFPLPRRARNPFR